MWVHKQPSIFCSNCLAKHNNKETKHTACTQGVSHGGTSLYCSTSMECYLYDNPYAVLSINRLYDWKQNK